MFVALLVHTLLGMQRGDCGSRNPRRSLQLPSQKVRVKHRRALYQRPHRRELKQLTQHDTKVAGTNNKEQTSLTM
jgi:hypothetical protein